MSYLSAFDFEGYLIDLFIIGFKGFIVGHIDIDSSIKRNPLQLSSGHGDMLKGNIVLLPNL
mgnify:CR=1 FL=1